MFARVTHCTRAHAWLLKPGLDAGILLAFGEMFGDIHASTDSRAIRFGCTGRGPRSGFVACVMGQVAPAYRSATLAFDIGATPFTRRTSAARSGSPYGSCGRSFARFGYCWPA